MRTRFDENIPPFYREQLAVRPPQQTLYRRNCLVVEYTLRDMTRPVGVSACPVTEALPETLRGSLPTIEQLEAEFAGW